MNFLLPSLAGLSCALNLWQWLAARSGVALEFFLIALLVRGFAALHLQWKLTGSCAAA